MGESDTFQVADAEAFQQVEGNMSHPGSFIEGPDQMDVVVDGLQNINAEDEFKTSEHDENEYQADAEAGKSQDLRGTPSSLNPLTEKVML